MRFNNRFKLAFHSRILLVIFICGTFCAFCSCKKAIQQQEKNVIISAMTTGHWYVEQYIQYPTTDLTGSFALYEFQFYEDGKVDGISPSVTQSGNWTADISSYTITANFPAASSDTLKLLNYTWKITDSYLDYVVAQTPVTGGNNILHLRKKS